MIHHATGFAATVHGEDSITHIYALQWNGRGEDIAQSASASHITVVHETLTRHTGCLTDIREDGSRYRIARILLCRIELDDKKETLQSQRSKRRQKIIREKLDEWCATKGYRDTSLNMITLSRSLNISRYELSRYLSSCLNTTFRPWLAEVRFEAAKKMMLDNPDFGNDIISAECGFSSRTHLYRMFKEKEGCSPTAWREKNC